MIEISTTITSLARLLSHAKRFGELLDIVASFKAIDGTERRRSRQATLGQPAIACNGR